MPSRLRNLSSDLPFTTPRNNSIFFCSIDLEDDAGSQTVLHIESLGHALHAFINGKLAGNDAYTTLFIIYFTFYLPSYSTLRSLLVQCLSSNSKLHCIN